MKKTWIPVCVLVLALISSLGASPTTIKFMHWWSYVDDSMLDDFRARHPDIKVELEYVAIGNYATKLRMLSSSGSLPDVFGLQGPEFNDFVKQSLVADIQKDLKTPAWDKKTAWGETIQPSLMKSMNSLIAQDLLQGGKMFGVPFGAIATAVVYNKSIFEKVGIKEPETWAEFLSNNDKLKAAGYIPMSFVGKIGWKSWWYKIALDQTMQGVTPQDFVDGKVRLDDPRVVEAFNVVKDMWMKGHFDAGGFTNGIEETQALFVRGRLAQFFIVPENFVTYLIENSPKDAKLDAYVLPAMKGLSPNRANGGASNVIAVNSATKNRDAAIALAKYLSSDTLFAKLAPINVVPSTVQPRNVKSASPIMKVFADATADGFMTIHLPTNLYKALDQMILNDLYPRMLLKKEPVELLLKEAQALLEKEMAAAKK